jgi:tetratricopeptide (TPR) repeat protein
VIRTVTSERRNERARPGDGGAGAGPTTVAANLAVCPTRQGKVKEAEAECENLVKRIAAAIPKDETVKPPQPSPAQLGTRRLAQTTNDIAEAFLSSDRYEEAVAWADRAAAGWADSRKRWPLQPGDPAPYRPPHWVKAVALDWLDKGEEAVTAIDESIKVASPEEKLYQRMMKARYVVKSGKHKEAAKLVVEIQAEANPNPNFWDASLAYSLCVKATKGDEKLQEEYAKAAIALLQKALDAG